MKAVIFSRYGGPETLRVEEVEKPVPTENEVRLRIHAASINSWDWELLRGVPFINRIAFGLFRPNKIKSLGCDVAGVVEAVGNRVHRFKPGDEVFGDLSHLHWGGFAEFVTAAETALTIKPARLSFEQAAAVPQAGLLAWQALQGNDSITAGQKVLISGASGGSGSFAVQLAKLAGAEVTGVCHSSKMEFVRSLGADHVIDYTQEDFTRSGEMYDLIVDMMNMSHSLFDYLRILSPRGRLYIVGGATGRILPISILGPLLSLLGKRQAGLLLHKPNRGLSELGVLLESGKVRPIIDRVFSLEQTAEAMRYFGDHRACGKVVIRMVSEK